MTEEDIIASFRISLKEFEKEHGDASFSTVEALANLGDEKGQFIFAVMHFIGDGTGPIAQHYVLAHKWANLAALAGEERTVKLRDLIATKMSHEQIGQAQDLVQKYLHREIS